jgi:hypothetical protein
MGAQSGAKLRRVPYFTSVDLPIQVGPLVAGEFTNGHIFFCLSRLCSFAHSILLQAAEFMRKLTAAIVSKTQRNRAKKHRGEAI